MYLVGVEIKESPIEGKGVYSLENIIKGKVIWKFDSSHDESLTLDDFNKLSDKEQQELQRIAYLSPTSRKWVFPPKGDPARYTNHSNSNNLSVRIDLNESSEPLFVANRNVKAGEELTVNYKEFDDRATEEVINFRE